MIKVRFLITKWIQENVEITEEEYKTLETMNITEQEYFFYEKSRFFDDNTVDVEYSEIKDEK